MIKSILLTPKIFFEKTVKNKHNLKIPIFITLVFGLTIFLQSSLPYLRFWNIFQNDEKIIILTMLVMFFVFGVCISFLLLFIITSIFWIGAKLLFKKIGNFKKTLEIVGYGFLPIIFGNIAYLIIWLACMYNISPEIIHVIQNHPQYLLAVSEALIPNEVYYVLILINIISCIWSSLLWAEGLKQLYCVKFLKSLSLTIMILLLLISLQLLTIIFG
ncbi:YIP1 family protein [Methanococcus aeolicus]|uniref:Yip1 domain-containing protein n=1 Tax=Methanococcus aeolicus (strain ATCC BAA-1280 / DSM 17508 / OCM 812 / Nankai-3) TaxID=419665 RepID=A6UUE5_META3|nr:YIP1 family protein [Methanococcus aeolicus]ABR56117.1 hypothetical protein Maeo_0531 [Methanococcus aeolicus Nankai-3]UXM85274.1 YIP1 family protein [Methanococcus aeolicus]